MLRDAMQEGELESERLGAAVLRSGCRLWEGKACSEAGSSVRAQPEAVCVWGGGLPHGSQQQQTRAQNGALGQKRAGK